MAPATEYGPVREIWLAPLSSPSSKKSFLIRDDAYSKAGAVFGRTLRLGDPVDLGPNSTWRQVTWEGGRDQTVWNDQAMFSKGNADVTSKPGKMRLWPGWQRIAASHNRAFTKFTLFRGNSGTFAGDTPLWIGEYDQFWGRGLANGNLYKYDPTGTGPVSTERTFVGGTIASMGACFDTNTNKHAALLVSLTNGQIWTRDVAGTWVNEYTVAAPMVPSEQKSVAVFNGLTYIAINNAIIRRITGPVSYQTIHPSQGQNYTRGLTVWNNRLWWLAVFPGERTALYVSDGATMVQAFVMPDSFHGMDLCVHYGSLYICGHTTSAKNGDGIIGQVWRYNGSSLTRVFQSGDEVAGERHIVYEMATLGKYLAWGRPGFPSLGVRPGLVLYDAELDAIIDGPNLEIDPAAFEVHVNAVTSYGGGWAVSMYDTKNYTPSAPNGPLVVMRTRPENFVRNDFTTISAQTLSGKSFEGGTTTKEQFVLSSVFDGEIPGEKKTWLAGRIRVKVPNNSSVIVKALLDESTTEVQVASIAYDAAQLDFRTVIFPLKDGAGAYMKSTTIQYKVYLRNTAASVASVENPNVDTIELLYKPAPAKRRQWSCRVLASNAQKRLDGSTNSLTTTDAIINELETRWSAQTPVLFWDADPDGGTPSDGSGTEVWIESFQANTYKADSEFADINGEVALSLTEVVTA